MTSTRDFPEIRMGKCGVCGETKDPKKCSQCLIQVYCSLEHQRKDWKNHKTVCRSKAATKVTETPESPPPLSRMLTSSHAACPLHKTNFHDVFINYRVSTDGDLARMLAMELERLKKDDGTPVTCFFDKHCLAVGNNWEDGFLTGLEGAALIILLISERGVSKIRTADKEQDNVLLEYEYALEKMEKGTAQILPLYVMNQLEGALSQFSSYNCSVFPMKTHKSPRSTKLVYNTMSSLFKIQGKTLNPTDFNDTLNGSVLKLINETLKSLSRLGSPVFLQHKLQPGDLRLSTGELVEMCKTWGFGDGHPVLTMIEENLIDGETLREVDDEFLVQSGVTNRFHRLKFMRKSETLVVDTLASKLAGQPKSQPAPVQAPNYPDEYEHIPLELYKPDGIHHFINKDYPGLQAICSDPWIFIVNDFFTPEECQQTMARGGSELKQEAGEHYTTSNSCWPAMLVSTEDKFEKLFSLPSANMEPTKVTGYVNNTSMRPHFDSTPGGPYQRCTMLGSNRTVAAIVYLHDIDNGGETKFLNLDSTTPTFDFSLSNRSLTVKAKQGRVLLFCPSYLPTASSTDSSEKQPDVGPGKIDCRLLHTGCTVRNSKMVCVKWAWPGVYDLGKQIIPNDGTTAR